MDFENMTIEQVEARMAEIETELNSEDADLEALKAEVDGLTARKAAIKAAAEEKRALLEKVANSKIAPVAKVEEERKENKVETEIRNSKAYINAYAEYVKTGDDREARALLTENVSGGVLPVPSFVGDIIAEEFSRSEILDRISKNYVRGNFKQPFEYGAPIAVAHTEGGDAVTEEALLLGFVEMKPTTWKKWVAVSDETLDNYNGEAFLRYIYAEIARGIRKAREKAVIDAILAAPQTATSSRPSVAKTGSAAGAISDIIDAIALLGDAAEDLVVIVSKSDYAAYKTLQLQANYGVDPFDGLTVIKSNYATVPIVGDLRGVMENFNRGEDDVQIKLDDVTRKKEDIVEILGRQPSAIAVVGDKFFAKVSA